MNKTFFYGLFVIISSFLVACAPQPVHINTPFNLIDYNHFMQAGTASIEGQAFLKQRGGGIVTCAGSEVILMPHTAYFTEMVNIQRMNSHATVLSTMRSNQNKVSRITTCDSEGKFSFNNIPEASWYLTTKVSWVVGTQNQGGLMLKEVHTKSGEVLNKILTGGDLIAR